MKYNDKDVSVIAGIISSFNFCVSLALGIVIGFLFAYIVVAMSGCSDAEHNEDFNAHFELTPNSVGTIIYKHNMPLIRVVDNDLNIVCYWAYDDGVFCLNIERGTP